MLVGNYRGDPTTLCRCADIYHRRTVYVYKYVHSRSSRIGHIFLFHLRYSSYRSDVLLTVATICTLPKMSNLAVPLPTCPNSFSYLS